MKNLKFTALGSNPNSNAMKKYKESLHSLSKAQYEASIGLMLGDASLQTQNKGKTFRLKFEWGDRSKAYVNHVHSLFNEWVLSEPHKKIRKSPGGNTVINWGFQTMSHTAFNPLADLFNLNPNTPASLSKQSKGISSRLILDHLSPRGLAYWFMDDGGKLDYNEKSKNKGVVLNTQSFTSDEVEMMSLQLKAKFNLECLVRNNKGKKVIVIKALSYPIFRELIDPYMLPEMLYKLP